MRPRGPQSPAWIVAFHNRSFRESNELLGGEELRLRVLTRWRQRMKREVFGFLVMAAAAISPAIVSAQSVPRGAERGAREGERAAGPVGAIVVATVGGVVGGVAGILGVD